MKKLTILLVLALATSVAAWGQTPGKSAWPANIPDADRPAVAFVTGGEYHQDAGTLSAVLLNTSGDAVNATAQMGLQSLDRALKTGNPTQVTGFVAGISSGITISFSDEAKVVSAVFWFRWDQNWVMYARVGCGNPVLVWQPIAKREEQPDLTEDDPCQGRVLTAQFVSLGSAQGGTHVRLIQVTGSNPVGRVTWTIQPQAGATVTATNATNEWVISGTVVGTLVDDCGSSTATFTEELVEVPAGPVNAAPPSDNVVYDDEIAGGWGGPATTPQYQEVIYRDVQETVYREYIPSSVGGVSVVIDFSFGFVPGWIQYQNCWVAPGCTPPSGWQCPSPTIVNNYINNSVVNNYYGDRRKERTRPRPDQPDDGEPVVGSTGDGSTGGPVGGDTGGGCTDCPGYAQADRPDTQVSDPRSTGGSDRTSFVPVREPPQRDAKPENRATGGRSTQELLDQANKRVRTTTSSSRNYSEEGTGSVSMTQNRGRNNPATRPEQQQPSRPTTRQQGGGTTRPSVDPSGNRGGGKPATRPQQQGPRPAAPSHSRPQGQRRGGRN